MAHILKALVGESSTTTGTGAFTLAAALTDHRRFSAVCATNDTVEYMIRHATNGSWEAGIGTYSSANTLTRTTMIESSTGSAIDFAAGDKTVIITPLARSLGVSPTLTTPDIGTPSAGALTNCTADGTNAVGFKTIPQNSKSTAYTLVLADSGKHILHPSADTTARTMTIPANSSVAYPIGTALTFVNQASAGVMTIAITTDTMRLAGAGTTGSRTLAANGIATALKVTSTEWIISGTGLT
jgi:hypothetical protein